MMCSLVEPTIIIQYTIFGDQKIFTTPLLNAWNWDDLYEIGDAKRREAWARSTEPKQRSRQWKEPHLDFHRFSPCGSEASTTIETDGKWKISTL